MKKPKDIEMIEAVEKDLAAKKAEYELAEKTLAEMKAAQPQGGYVNGIFMALDEIERAEEIKRESAEAAERGKEPKPEPPPFIPNRYIAQKEKTELAEMMLYKNLMSEQKSFIDPRHKKIYDVYRNELANRRGLNFDGLINALQSNGVIEAAGGEGFIRDIFQGLPE
jgi:hypothetical protein